MYAIIKVGGKQYRVAKDDIIEVELLDAEQGAHVHFKEILFVDDGTSPLVGGPHVPGFIVTGQLLDTVSGPKITSVKYKRSHNTRKKFGHRQHYSRVKITEIGKGGKKHGS